MATNEATIGFEVARMPWPSCDFERIKSLHRANSHSLGFFPSGAFEDHAQKGQVLVAKDDDLVVGYLLYRVARYRASIVHLCIDSQFRGRGIARLLVEELKRVTKPLAGIGLRCRQDNCAKPLWPQLGFSAMGRKIGRSRDGHELTFWWFDHQHQDLFSNIPVDERRSRVVIDANVFFDLQGREEGDNDSQALLADWVQGTIELCVTRELPNEIDRCTNSAVRERSLAHVTHYHTMVTDDALFQSVCEELKPLFPDKNPLRHGSDLRQVAYAIVSNTSFFVTRDVPLINRCDSLYERFGLHVLRPGELINRLDVLEREDEYRPARIHGSRWKIRTLMAEDVDDVVGWFLKSGSERQGDFKRKILHWLGLPRTAQTRLVTDDEGRPVLFAVVDKEASGKFIVAVLRLAKHQLASTLLRNFIRTTLDAASDEGSLLVTVPDVVLDEEARTALKEFGFRQEHQNWVKIAQRVLADFDGLHRLVSRAATLGLGTELTQNAQQAIESVRIAQSAESVAVVEAFFWPAKLRSDALPTFIVPIRAEWAQHFFDEDLGSELLFGPRVELHLGVEGVYFCSPNHLYISAPARILWYVSKGKAGNGSMSIKACSRLDGVEIGEADEIFRRFRRLGVYGKRHIREAVKGKSNANLMAIRFSMTERFARPVNLSEINQLDVRGNFQSPRKIFQEQFAAIYSTGFNLHS